MCGSGRLSGLSKGALVMRRSRPTALDGGMTFVARVRTTASRFRLVFTPVSRRGHLRMMRIKARVLEPGGGGKCLHSSKLKHAVQRGRERESERASWTARERERKEEEEEEAERGRQEQGRGESVRPSVSLSLELALSRSRARSLSLSLSLFLSSSSSSSSGPEIHQSTTHPHLPPSVTLRQS